MQRPFAGVRSDIVEKVREVGRVIPVQRGIRVGGARATAVSSPFFFSLSFVLTAEFASVTYEKQKQDCSAVGRVT